VEKLARGKKEIKRWLVSGTRRGTQLTQKECPSFFYQKAEETFNPVIY